MRTGKFSGYDFSAELNFKDKSFAHRPVNFLRFYLIHVYINLFVLPEAQTGQLFEFEAG